MKRNAIKEFLPQPPKKRPVTNQNHTSLDPATSEIVSTIREPIAQHPIIQEHTTQDLITQEPITHITQDPITQDPITQDPITQGPITQNLIIQDPIAQDPTNLAPINPELTAQKFTTSDSTTSDLNSQGAEENSINTYLPISACTDQYLTTTHHIGDSTDLTSQHETNALSSSSCEKCKQHIKEKKNLKRKLKRLKNKIDLMKKEKNLSLSKENLLNVSYVYAIFSLVFMCMQIEEVRIL